MLTHISVTNFQKHKNLELELDHKILVLCGKTGIGKSSIIRAIRWLCLNKQFVSYIKRGENECLVTLEVDNNTIERVKGKHTNEYRLNGSKYNAIGASKVPDDISKILNVGKLNFSRQLDLPLWFSLSPGQVSKELNTIIRLDVIDSSLAKAASAVRNSKTEVKICEERLKVAKQKKKELLWVKDINEDLIELEALNKDIIELQEKTSRISELTVGLNEGLKKLQDVSDELSDCEEVVLRFPYKTAAKLKKIQKLFNELNSAKEKLAQANNAEEKVQKELDNNVGIVCNACGQQIIGSYLHELPKM